MMNAIEWLLEIPVRNATRTFLIDVRTGEELTFGAYHESGLRVAADLKRRGFGPGDRLAVMLHNSPDFARLYLGCLYARVVVVPVNPVLGPKEVEYIVRTSGPKAIVVSGETAGPSAHLDLGGFGVPLWQLMDGRAGTKSVKGAEKWELTNLSDASDFVPLEAAQPDDLLAIVYTSGTTARPKGVVHRVANLIDNARLFGKRVGIGPDNRFYGILAMTYLGGYYNLLLLPYALESSVVLSDTFDARSALTFWEPAIKHDVNTLWLVPTIMSILMEVDRGEHGATFCREKVSLSLVGTAPLPAVQRARFEKRYGVSLYENYGLSETLFISANAPTLPVLDGCVGRILPSVDVAILNEEGKSVSYGEEGEIHVCTPHVMEGYFDAEANEAEPLDREKWFATGDIGILTQTGDLFITGREKDLIIRGGINISPAAIENVILDHAEVRECAVVGVPHPMYGEDIAAVVRLDHKADFKSVTRTLETLCKEVLGTVKQPSHLLEIESFPKSATGKIQKDRVREYIINKLGIREEFSSSISAASSAPTVLRGTVRRSFARPDPDVVEALSVFPVSVVSDCLNRLGCMDAAIQPVVRGRPFCGSALTVEEVEGGNLMSHAALELLQPGDVLVIDAKGCTTRSCWGGVQTRMAVQRGVAGIVIDGVIRDYDDVLSMAVPIYARGLSPTGPLKGWAGYVNRSVACGGVSVQPGDIVMGDDDGVVVVPQDLAHQLPPLCAQRVALEEIWVQRIEAGEATLDVVGLRKKLDELGIEYL